MSDDTKQAAICCALAGIVLVAAILSMSSCATRSTEQYYVAMKRCTDGGGSWIPTGNDNAACIMPKQPENRP